MIDFLLLKRHIAFWEDEALLGLGLDVLVPPKCDFVGEPPDWAIGFGSSYINGLKVGPHTPPITMRQVWHELCADLWEAAEGARRVWPFLDDLDSIVNETLIGMVFQMGATRMRRWTNTRKALMDLARIDTKEHRQNVVHHMRDSIWYRKDTPKRATWATDRILLNSRLEPKEYRYPK